MSRPFNDFIVEINRYSQLVRKQNLLMAAKQISSKDLDFIYEIAFLSAYSSFEIFVERQFEGLLIGRPYYNGKTVSRRVAIGNERIAREIIGGTGGFPRYLPIDNLERLAKIFFRNGEPFTLLNDLQKSSLRKGQIIRNCIAHRSKSSKENFENRVLSGMNLRPRDKNPAGYLRSEGPTGQNRYEQTISELVDIALVMTKSTLQQSLL